MTGLLEAIISALPYVAAGVGAAILIAKILEAKSKNDASNALAEKFDEAELFMNYNKEKFLDIYHRNPEEFSTDELKKHLIMLSSSLSEEERKKIKYILEQPSERGKRAYIESVFE